MARVRAIEAGIYSAQPPSVPVLFVPKVIAFRLGASFI